MVLHNLGDIARAHGDLEVAEEYYQQTLQIREKLAPDSWQEAEALEALGNIFYQTQQRGRAIQYFHRSINALEGQIGQLGGSQEVKTSFRVLYGHYYRKLIEILLELNHPKEAFFILERSRARSFLELLAERDLVFDIDIPGALERERSSLAVQYERTQQRISELNPKEDPAQLESLLSELQTLRRKYDENAAEIRELSPRLAALHYPQPLDIQGAQEVLDPGTLMLSYSVGEETTDLFVVTPAADATASVALLALEEGQQVTDVEPITDVRMRAARKRGDSFNPLPYTRHEVHQIASLYPPGAVQIYLAADATEERAKTLGKDVRIVHIAAHGTLDDRFPLDSALALAIPEEFTEDRENGLLQVWEIFERVRIDADLMVLSACDSAVGQEQGGEGLISLTRAFQYAGARSVAATLWSVADQSTAELMIRFYRHLRSGKPKDEALRAAQLEFIRSPVRVKDEKGQWVERDVSAPFYWAAFQIIGDWQ